jgi:hypothetical protein
MGYAPAVPAHGAEEQTGEQSKSLFPYFGAGKLEEAGVVDVKVDKTTNKVYFSDHFAGLSVIDNADEPTITWHGPDGIGTYNNDTSAPLGDHWPDYKFVTSYDMTPISVDDEAMPEFLFQSPILLTTGEVSGHGSMFTFTQAFDSINSTGTDVLLTAGGGGLSFLDVKRDADQASTSFDSLVHIATTNEIGAAADGTATQEINIGHSEGITAYNNLVFLADGPHGMSVWNVANEQCIPTDDVHIVANTLQDEYPVTIDGVTINPTPHAYDVALKGTLAFTADGSNGLTVYDLSKDPAVSTSGYIVSNIGGETDSSPSLGHATGVKLWTDASTSKIYAFIAAGHAGFGIVSYSIADLIAPLIEGTDPTSIWGSTVVDQRPIAKARFKLQDEALFGDATLVEWSGGAAGMDVVSVNGKNLFYVAYGDAGVIKIDWTDPANPILVQHSNTVGASADVSVLNGRVYLADGSGGLVLFK